MSDFAPPSGPPPPRVPEGWKAVWNDQYKEWFYVNLHTKQSSWEKPTAPALRPGEDQPPDGPPSYSSGPGAGTGTADHSYPADIKRPLSSNNPYSSNSGGAGGPAGETDEQLARRLQAEENARNHGGSTHSGDRGAANDYYNSGNGGAPGYNASTNSQGYPHSPQPQPAGIQGGYPGAPGSSQQDSGTRSSGGGFLGKLKSKLGGGGGSAGGFGSGASHGYPQPGYNQHYGGGGYPQQGYGGYPQQQQMMYGQQPMMAGRQKKHGMGAGGAAALGVGGGLVGGMLLADALDDNDYQEGYQEGYDDGGGGDFDGGDF